jgi:hypothetical protein
MAWLYSKLLKVLQGAGFTTTKGLSHKDTGLMGGGNTPATV